jgi:Zn-dependent oligopeptidase
MDLTATIEQLRRQTEKLERVIASLKKLHAANTVQELCHEKERLERVIASLEKLQAPGPIRTRGGRKSMSPEERQEVSERMKKYWEKRRNQRPPWS